MEVFLNIKGRIIHINIPLYGEGVIGDSYHQLKPGDKFLGYSYSEIRELGTGRHDIEPTEAWTRQRAGK